MLRGLLVLVALPVAVGVAAWLWHMYKHHGAGPLIWRYVSGMPLDGRDRTDATWFRSSSVALHPLGKADPSRVHPWHHLPRIERAASRDAPVAAVVLCAWGLATARPATLVACAACVLAAAGWGAWRAYRKVSGWHHHRHYVQPLSWSLTEAIAAPARVEIVRAGAEVKSVTAAWPPDTEIGPKEQEFALQAVSTRLALEGAVPKWNLKGRNREGIFTPCPSPPPTVVTLRDIHPAIQQAALSVLIAGIGQRNTAVPIDLHSDACHLALSIGPGGGKTLAARALAIQVLAKGGWVIVLNAKKTGYNWTRGLPNVAHAKTIDDIADTLLWLNTERKRREDVVEAAGDIEDEVPDHVKVGPRILVVFEEQNLTVPKLRKEREDAFEALGDLNFAGRAALIHLLAIAQRYSAKAAGGGDVRAAVNARIIGRFDKKAWNMLADSFPVPALNNAPGRVQVVTDEVHEAQMPKVSGQEAHDYALSGTVALCPPDMPCRCAVGVPVLAGALQNNGSEQPLSYGTSPQPQLPPGLIGLTAAVADGVVSLSLAAVRKRQQRDPSFPAADPDRRGPRDEMLFDLTELMAWEDAR